MRSTLCLSCSVLVLALIPAPVRAALTRTVTVQSAGPALVAHATAAPGDPGLYVIGYRRTGALSDAATHVNAYMKVRFDVVRVTHPGVLREFVLERSIPIGREPNGTGYLSRALTMNEIFDLDPGHGDQFVPVRVKSIDLAFFVDGRWDSNSDRNYPFSVEEPHGCTYACQSPAPADQLPADAWGFIVGQMR